MSYIGFVYIMTNKNKTVLYIGVTNNLCRRIFEHKNHLNKKSFTDNYQVENCIFYEEFSDFNLAIKRETEIKKWNREKKEALINKKNPEWKVLATEKGFIQKNNSFAKQVSDVLKDFEKEYNITPFNRNDNQPLEE